MTVETVGKPLRMVNVVDREGCEEFYSVGKDNVTAIEWGTQNGHMAAIPTVRVFKDGKLLSEHPFHNVLGVYFAEGKS